MDEFLELRKELYRQTIRSVEKILGPETADLKKYRLSYNRAFRSKWDPYDREFLLKDLSQRKIIYMSDFHALQQSQKAQLRILQSVKWKVAPALAVEFIQAKHQKHLNLFLSGQTSETTFLKAVNWNKQWGFPWENYRPLLVWAKKNKSPVIALNQGHNVKSSPSLIQRDRQAAQKIVQQVKRAPERPVFVIFGDLHLSPNHLPAQVAAGLKMKKTDSAIILQNSENIYFQMLEKQMEFHVDVIKFSNSLFCIQSVPPWVKWQNYLLYLESQGDLGLGDDTVDFSDHVQRALVMICKDLKIKLPLAQTAIYTATDEIVWQKISNQFDLPTKKLFEKRIEKSDSFFIPELQVGFLGRPTVNHSAIIAAHIAHNHLAGLNRSLIHFPEDFERLIWSEAVAYFCTKLINPKRKTDTVHDIKLQLENLQAMNANRDSLELALQQKNKEALLLRAGQKAEIRSARRKSSYASIEAARLLGGMMGEKMYLALRKGWISKQNLLSLISRSVDQNGFSTFYMEVLELIDHWPEPFVSKSHKL
jgi:hypothetical protein